MSIPISLSVVADFRFPLRALKKELPFPTGERHNITIVFNTSRVRLVGMFFDLNKCFLLPSAMHGIRKFKAVYEEHSDANLLCVGHTDTSGRDAYNLTLSLERADSIAAYLTDDVDRWEAFFGPKPPEKRWGTLEIQLMLSKLPEGQPPFYEGTPNGREDAKHDGAVRRFQQAEGLTSDGVAGPVTRRALIAKYMGLDGTTLPAGTTLTTHGCGENFPVDATGDGVRDRDNRRVEIFLFDGPIVPPPPGKTSARGSKEYPQWLAKVVETIDVSLADPEPTSLTIRFHDQDALPLTNVSFRVSISGTPDVSGVSADGFATVPLPAFCPERIIVEWGSGPDGKFLFSRDIVVDCEEGTNRQQATSKLANLGYPSSNDDEFEIATRKFQAEYRIPEDGLADGDLPPATRARLDAIYAATLDATRPAESSTGSDIDADDGEPPAITLSMECAL
jgi:outer membrane protein OmpA-like peptidoglycan-associated protein